MIYLLLLNNITDIKISPPIYPNDNDAGAASIAQLVKQYSVNLQTMVPI